MNDAGSVVARFRARWRLQVSPGVLVALGVACVCAGGAVWRVAAERPPVSAEGARLAEAASQRLASWAALSPQELEQSLSAAPLGAPTHVSPGSFGCEEGMCGAPRRLWWAPPHASPRVVLEAPLPWAGLSARERAGLALAVELYLLATQQGAPVGLLLRPAWDAHSTVSSPPTGGVAASELHAEAGQGVRLSLTPPAKPGPLALSGPEAALHPVSAELPSGILPRPRHAPTATPTPIALSLEGLDGPVGRGLRGGVAELSGFASSAFAVVNLLCSPPPDGSGSAVAPLVWAGLSLPVWLLRAVLALCSAALLALWWRRSSPAPSARWLGQSVAASLAPGLATPFIAWSLAATVGVAEVSTLSVPWSLLALSCFAASVTWFLAPPSPPTFAGMWFGQALLALVGSWWLEPAALWAFPAVVALLGELVSAPRLVRAARLAAVGMALVLCAPPLALWAVESGWSSPGAFGVCVGGLAWLVVVHTNAPGWQLGLGAFAGFSIAALGCVLVPPFSVSTPRVANLWHVEDLGAGTASLAAVDPFGHKLSPALFEVANFSKDATESNAAAGLAWLPAGKRFRAVPAPRDPAPPALRFRPAAPSAPLSGALDAPAGELWLVAQGDSLQARVQGVDAVGTPLPYAKGFRWVRIHHDESAPITLDVAASGDVWIASVRPGLPAPLGPFVVARDQDGAPWGSGDVAITALGLGAPPP